MLNAAAMIFSIDIVQKYLTPRASQQTVVNTSRLSVGLFAVVARPLRPLVPRDRQVRPAVHGHGPGPGHVPPGPVGAERGGHRGGNANHVLAAAADHVTGGPAAELDFRHAFVPRQADLLIRQTVYPP